MDAILSHAKYSAEKYRMTMYRRTIAHRQQSLEIKFQLITDIRTHNINRRLLVKYKNDVLN